MLKQKLIIFLLIVFCWQSGYSQIHKRERDTAAVYKSIQTFAKKNKFTKLVHRLVFRPVRLKVDKKKALSKSPQNHEGKIIRRINIITLDPFGFSEIDSSRKPRNWAEREGNRLHIKTNRLAIRNLLLIRRNRPLDSLLMKESERLIRTQRYVSRANITSELSKNSNDSVDVTVRVLDTWSIIPKGSISSSRYNIDLNERNFMGSGHEFDNKFKKRFSDGKSAYSLAYTIPNIKNTFIKTTARYFIDLDEYYGKSINIERPFYSPLTKWAGGVYFDQQFRQDTMQNSNLVYAKQNFKYNSQDYWVGKAFKLFKGNTESDRTTNLIVSGRFLNVEYIERPTIEYDSIDFFSSEKFILLGIGFNSRKFIEDRYIFKNGIIEDVPIGKIYGITGGYQWKNNIGRYYAGAQASFGNYYKYGFLSANFEVGTYFDKGKTTQSALSVQANYFTNLIDLGRWKLRQFIKPQFLLGLDRAKSIGDQLTINENNGINGFRSAQYGTQKLMLTLQTQAYAPWDLWGFRLNPYFNYSIAMLGNEERGLRDSKAYSKIGVGFIINNDFLVFSSFQISLSYYPSIPDSGNHIFKTNSFETTDFGFQNFELAKPRTVLFK